MIFFTFLLLLLDMLRLVQLHTKASYNLVEALLRAGLWNSLDLRSLKLKVFEFTDPGTLGFHSSVDLIAGFYLAQKFSGETWEKLK